jgi:hypothetical protein
MLNGPNAGSDCLIDPVGRVGMGGNGYIVSSRLSDSLSELIRAKGNIARIIADGMKGARHQQLNPIRAILNFITNGFTDFNRTIRYQSIRNQGLFWRTIVDITTAPVMEI